MLEKTAINPQIAVLDYASGNFQQAKKLVPCLQLPIVKTTQTVSEINVYQKEAGNFVV